jgi:hypothetical protein
MTNISTESELLAQVLIASPVGSVWSVSKDSFEDIRLILKGFIPFSQQGSWGLEINDSNRIELANYVLTLDLGCKIIHTSVSFNANELFEAFDVMSTISMSKEFWRENGFDNKFSQLEILV